MVSKLESDYRTTIKLFDRRDPSGISMVYLAVHEHRMQNISSIHGHSGELAVGDKYKIV